MMIIFTLSGKEQYTVPLEKFLENNGYDFIQFGTMYIIAGDQQTTSVIDDILRMGYVVKVRYKHFKNFSTYTAKNKPQEE